jgi:hypothetical protein
MPMYYFHLRGDQDQITDEDGTDLADVDAAREHADTVARELTFKTTGMLGEDWSKWSMVVHDGDGVELFSFGMSSPVDPGPSHFYDENKFSSSSYSAVMSLPV